MSDITGQFAEEMSETCRKITAPGKGILAADESTNTIKKRFDKIGVENTEENRRNYRELLFRTKGVGEFVSGVILFEETLFQKAADGTPLVELIKAEGTVPGIKVDKGLVIIPGTEDETATQGLDKLAERCQQYYEGGARFAKWRATYKITDTLPSDLCIKENAHTLARYAAICQSNGLVPIVEPEILMDGTHTIDRSAEVTEKVLTAVFEALKEHHIVFERMLLKPNMVIAGYECPEKASPEKVGEYTVRVLEKCVPNEVPGIMFLSGGQNEQESTANLNEINKVKKSKTWHLSFSYGRALQASAQKAWSGKAENVEAASKTYYKRAKLNSLAVKGEYAPSME